MPDRRGLRTRINAWRRGRKAAKRTHHQVIHGKALGQVLIANGIIPEKTRRTIIDIPANGAVTLYTEHYGDERLFDISIYGGVEVRK